MKKNFLILVFAVFNTISYSQVGIGTTSPHEGSILDLTATNKALLLPRVASTGAISSPVNGMMIYDISSNCVKSYENDSWTACLSDTSGGGSTLSTQALYPSELEFKQLSFVDTSGEAYYDAWGVTTSNELYAWGRNYYSTITNGIASNPSWIALNTSSAISAPTHINHANFNGIVDKVSTQGNTVAVLTTTGLVYAHGSKTYPGWVGSDKFPIGIIASYNSTNYNLYPQSPNGVGWKDIGMSCHRFYLIDANGAAFWSGAEAPYFSNVAVTSLQAIPHPTSGKKFEKVIPADLGLTLYLLDEDGKLWASGYNIQGQLGNGNTTNSSINALSPVQFVPSTSLRVVDVIYGVTNSKPAAAILEDGSAYVWGNTTRLNNILNAVDVSATKTTAVPLPLPAGATKFIKIGFSSHKILALTDLGLFQITTSTDWQLIPGTTGFVDMFEENQGKFNFSDANPSLGAHFLLDANKKLWVWGQTAYHLFTATEDYLYNCDVLNSNYRIRAFLPKRILNGNVFSSPYYTCSFTGPLVPFPEP